MVDYRFFKKGFIFHIIFVWIFIYSVSSAKSIDYNLKLYGYSSHFEKDWFFHPGIQIDRDLSLTNWFMARISAAVYRDSGHLAAGFIHAGVRINARKFNDFYIRLGLGPTFIWRQNWWVYKDTYDGNTFYGETYHSGPFEHTFLLFAGDIEVEWQLKSGKRFVFAVVPGYPVIIANSIGVRF